jgi:hypothetical protein
MAKFRKLPVVIDATRCAADHIIATDEGLMQARVGDWIITGIHGEMYPCQDEIFRKTYEPVDNDGKVLMGIEP